MVKFTRAKKSDAYIRLALIGPAGAGKTYTALRTARGLGGRVALIDSERGSASHYADEFEFDTVKLEKFSPKNYIEAIEAAVAQGYDVLIIDSLSHAWAGKGGVLEMHDEAARRDRTGNRWAAWREVSPEHNRLVDTILQAPLHVIATMRSKIEYVQDRDESGKVVIRKVGLQPVQRDGLEYEFDIVCDLDQTHTLVVSKTRCRALTDAVIREPGEDNFAALLRAWISDGAVRMDDRPGAEAADRRPELDADKPHPSTPSPQDEEDRATDEQMRTMWRLAQSLKMDVAALTGTMNEVLGRGYTSPREATQTEAETVIAHLRALVAERGEEAASA
jgi:hypothetical protein